MQQHKGHNAGVGNPIPCWHGMVPYDTNWRGMIPQSKPTKGKSNLMAMGSPDGILDWTL